ncbi:MAG: hypothetical protein ACNS63_06765 [Candidatus Nitrospinota bacterium M3_3B_026]
MAHDARKSKTRPIILSLVILTLSCSAPSGGSGRATTKDGHVACEKREWMEDMLDFIRTKNKAQFRRYIENKRCIFMKGGVGVKLLGTKAKPVRVVVAFEYQNKVMWTYWSSLVYD